MNSFVELTKKRPFDKIMVPAVSDAMYAPTKNTVEVTSTFGRMTAVLVSPPFFTVKGKKSILQVKNPFVHTYILDNSLVSAIVKAMMQQETVYNKPVPETKANLI